MSESMQLQDPLYKLVIRFSNGELIQYVTANPIDARQITPEARYAVVSSISCQNPSECNDVAVINLRDVSYLKTERVTLEQLTAERRAAGIRSSHPASPDDRLPKAVAQIQFH